MLITCWDEASQVLHVALKSNYLDGWLNTEPTDPYPFLAVASTNWLCKCNCACRGLDGYCVGVFSVANVNIIKHMLWPHSNHWCQLTITQMHALSDFFSSSDLPQMWHLCHTGDAYDTIMNYSIILHSWHFCPRVHVMGSRVWFHTEIWTGLGNKARRSWLLQW